MSRAHQSGQSSVAPAASLKPLGAESLRDRPARRCWPFALAIVALGLVAYATSLEGAFVFDDFARIAHNPALQDFSAFWQVPGVARRPLVSVTLALNYKLGALNPLTYHVFNLSVHLLASLTLFGVLHRIFRLVPSPWRDRPLLPAFLIALLWVVHPLNTQAVTYIIQRAESLMGLFYLLCLYCFLRAVQPPARSKLWFTLSILACCLSLASKAVAVTLPVMILLADRSLIAGSFTHALRARWRYYLPLACTWLLLFITGEPQGVLSADRPPEHATVGFSYEGVTPLQYLLTQGNVIVHYIGLTLWPEHLCFDYAWPIAAEPADWLPGCCVVLLLLAVTLWLFFKRPPLGFIGLWFFLILAPTSSFIPIKDLAVEHRMYLPAIAIIAVGALTILRAGALFGRWLHLPRAAIVGSVSILLLITLGFGVRTAHRNTLYQQPIALWEDVVENCASNVRAWSHLGFERWERARALRSTQPKQAADFLRKALQAYTMAAVIPSELSSEPPYAQAYVHAWMSMGSIHAELGSVTPAIHCFERAMQVNPIITAEAQLNIATLLTRAGRTAEAIERLQLSLRANNQHVPTYLALAAAYVAAGDAEKSLAAYQRAASMEPANVSALSGLGLALTQLGRYAEAEHVLRQATAYDPRHVGSHYNLAAALERQHRRDEAAAVCEYILTLEPGFLPAQRKLDQLRNSQTQPNS